MYHSSSINSPTDSFQHLMNCTGCEQAEQFNRLVFSEELSELVVALYK